MYLNGHAWFNTTVDADDVESAIEQAFEKRPNLCAQCSGWGREWSLELGDEWELDTVEDENGEEVVDGDVGV